MVGLTFRPQMEDGYTVPYTLNHYDTPGELPEYTYPLPPEPEYATPFGEIPIDSLTSPPLDSRHNTKLSTCRSTRGTSSHQRYDCPAHRVISNGYCTPVSHNTIQCKANVIYAEPQTVEPLLHTYHEPLWANITSPTEDTCALLWLRASKKSRTSANVIKRIEKKNGAMSRPAKSEYRLSTVHMEYLYTEH